MTRDTPIFLMAFQTLALFILEMIGNMKFETSMIIVLLGTIYLVWRTKKCIK